MTPLLLPLMIPPAAPRAEHSFAPRQEGEESPETFLDFLKKIEELEELEKVSLDLATEGTPLHQKEVFHPLAPRMLSIISQTPTPISHESDEIKVETEAPTVDVIEGDIGSPSPRASLEELPSPQAIHGAAAQVPNLIAPDEPKLVEADNIAQIKPHMPESEEAPHLSTEAALKPDQTAAPPRVVSSPAIVISKDDSKLAVEQGRIPPWNTLETHSGSQFSRDPSKAIAADQASDSSSKPPLQQTSFPSDLGDKDRVFVDLSEHQGVELASLHRDIPQSSAPIEAITSLEKTPLKTPLSEQVIAALPERSEEVTELTLHPEELGTIRMEFRGDSEKLSLMITAERPETLDLLRRQAERLLHEIRNSGYGDVKLDFGQSSQNSRDQQAARSKLAQGPEGYLHETPVARPTPFVETNRLYIRM